MTDAFLPFANDKPAELRRVFSDRAGHQIDISNKQFGMIEKNDALAVLLCDIGKEIYAAALKVHDPETYDVYAYIFSKKYLDMLKLYEEKQA